jgi:hypothetical protein
MDETYITEIITKFERLHKENEVRDLVLLAEVQKLTSRTLDSIDEASTASNLRTKIIQRTTIWNTQFLKLLLGTFILLGLLILILSYSDPLKIAESFQTFLLPLLGMIAGYAVWLLGFEAPKKIEKSASELPSTDIRSNSINNR